MSPDEAVSACAREALEVLNTMRRAKHVPGPADLAATVSTVTSMLVQVVHALAAEADQPGAIRSLPAEDLQHLLDSAKSAAAGAQVVFSMLPGVDDLQAPMLH